MKHHRAAIVLAAGKGARMKAPPTRNKVTFKLVDRPIISYTFETLKKCGFDAIVVVVGYASDSVRKILGDQVTYAIQESPKGTAHAVKAAMPFLPVDCRTVITLYGDDSAFYSQSLINQLITEHDTQNASVTLVTLHKKDPTGLGRIVRDNQGEITGIVEEKNATEVQKTITEINTGLYCFNKDFLKQSLEKIRKNSVSQEYYLTDIIDIAVSSGHKVHVLTWPNDDIWFGVNTRTELKAAEQRMMMKSKVKYT